MIVSILKRYMRKSISTLLLLLAVFTVWAQRINVREEVRADRNKCSGLDAIYDCSPKAASAAPKGYEAFYVSHYGRHGSRYAYTPRTYGMIARMLKAEDEKDGLTEFGKQLYARMQAFNETAELRVGDLTPLGWEQHQFIAKTMINSFPAAFRKGARVDAVSSPTPRSIISMGAFCVEVARLRPNIAVYEHQGLIEMQATRPNTKNNPLQYKGPELINPYAETSEEYFLRHFPTYKEVLGRMFKDTDRCLDGRTPFEVFFQLYMLVGGMQSLPEDCRVDLDGLFTPEEFAIMWECDNYERFREYYEYKTACSSIYDDMIAKADARIAQGERGADLRFGHDHCLMTLLMIADIEDFDTQPANNDELCYWFQTFRSMMATNLQLVFYAPKGWPKKQGDILVKLLFNGEDSRFGKLQTAQGPYYKWEDLKAYLNQRTRLFVNYNN